MVYDISSVAKSLESISRRLDTSHDLENINKNLKLISDRLELLCYIQFAFLRKQKLDIKINGKDFLRGFKCKY